MSTMRPQQHIGDGESRGWASTPCYWSAARRTRVMSVVGVCARVGGIVGGQALTFGRSGAKDSERQTMK